MIPNNCISLLHYIVASIPNALCVWFCNLLTHLASPAGIRYLCRNNLYPLLEGHFCVSAWEQQDAKMMNRKWNWNR
jgi:hypothetical protein